MNKLAVKKRIEQLRDQITELRYAYHVLNEPGITDEVYDSLSRELKGLEAEYPEFIDPNSVLNRVAGQPLDKFEKVKHTVRMLSLNDAFTLADLEAWEKRLTKLLMLNESLEFFCELKLDGLAVTLIYKRGKLVRGATRGDGLVGEDITQNLKMIKTIPLQLQPPYPEWLEVRGEAVMSKQVFNQLNRVQKQLGLPEFANTRNSAAGSLRQLDPRLTQKRNLDFFAYDIVEAGSPKLGMGFQTHSEKHKRLRKYGFQVDANEAVCQNLPAVQNFINHIAQLRANFSYGTDGVVISVNNLALQTQLGVVGKAPRYMVAFKYPAEKATTMVNNVIWNVGRTGVLTPLALFEPTLVAGSTIAKATLHNLDQIQRLDLRVGDTVVIHKAGDVIPEVVEVLPKLRSGKEQIVKIPKQCPVCEGVVEKREIGEKGKASTAYYCVNPKCPAKNRRFMEHFVSVLEIYEIGPKILERFQSEGLISDVADIFKLKAEDIKNLERFGEKSAENILASIEQHKHLTLPKLIFALGILHVGEQTAIDLARHFGSLEKLISATLDEINVIENIGPVVSQSVYNYFRDKDNLKFIEKLFKNGVSLRSYQLPTINNRLKGKTFVITGTLESLSRNEAKQKIRDLGGKISEAVSKLTSYVVTGSEPGSKFNKAKSLGVTILTEQEFLGLLKLK